MNFALVEVEKNTKNVMADIYKRFGPDKTGYWKIISEP